MTSLFSCNCILNYLYGGLEGKHTGSVYGPITFGEIAHLLLNQTLVQLKDSRCRVGPLVIATDEEMSAGQKAAPLLLFMVRFAARVNACPFRFGGIG